MKLPSKKFCQKYTEAMNTYLTAPRHGGITTAQIIALWKLRYEHVTLNGRKFGLPAILA